MRLKEIAPEGFRQSEYFRSYFARIGVSDLAGMLLPVAGGGVVHLSFARKTSGQASGDAMLGDLARLLPVFAALAQRHWQRCRAKGRSRVRAASPLEIMRAEFDLTRRETEIAEAMLAGHSIEIDGALAGDLGRNGEGPSQATSTPSSASPRRRSCSRSSWREE